MAGITKWFWVTIKEYLSYLLPKFEDLVPTSLGSGDGWPKPLNLFSGFDCTETGLEAIERLRFLASFPLPGTGKRE